MENNASPHFSEGSAGSSNTGCGSWRRSWDERSGFSGQHAGSGSEIDSIDEDKEMACKAVAYVIRNTRKGIVPLCSSIAQLLKTNRRLEQTVQSQQQEIQRLKRLCENYSRQASPGTETKSLDNSQLEAAAGLQANVQIVQAICHSEPSRPPLPSITEAQVFPGNCESEVPPESNLNMSPHSEEQQGISSKVMVSREVQVSCPSLPVSKKCEQQLMETLLLNSRLTEDLSKAWQQIDFLRSRLWQTEDQCRHHVHEALHQGSHGNTTLHNCESRSIHCSPGSPQHNPASPHCKSHSPQCEARSPCCESRSPDPEHDSGSTHYEPRSPGHNSGCLHFEKNNSQDDLVSPCCDSLQYFHCRQRSSLLDLGSSLSKQRYRQYSESCFPHCKQRSPTYESGPSQYKSRLAPYDSGLNNYKLRTTCKQYRETAGIWPVQNCSSRSGLNRNQTDNLEMDKFQFCHRVSHNEEVLKGKSDLPAESSLVSFLFPFPMIGCLCSSCTSFFGSQDNSRNNHEELKTLDNYQRQKLQVKLNDYVIVNGNKSGTVVYIGHLDNSAVPNAVYLGLELDEPSGKHDGTLNGKRYFKCYENCGLFVGLHEVFYVINSTPRQPAPFTRPHHVQQRASPIIKEHLSGSVGGSNYSVVIKKRGIGAAEQSKRLPRKFNRCHDEKLPASSQRVWKSNNHSSLCAPNCPPDFTKTRLYSREKGGTR
ncbi:uncharacterized protein LOC120529652 isoform X2 [Polypterus senegalus]|uniref:uncharacterized protein LOC120529652 isoform X2 n=1 Tax=Polypterus senegalus TaxID=55291 RepID=UPI0019669793|nr:uncharacterized protein LOC120529652 isoform X2 [Polypterus senegalus]